MLILLFLQSFLLAGVICAVVFWRIQISSRIRTIQVLQTRHGESEQRLQSMIVNLQVELNDFRRCLPESQPILLAPPTAGPTLTIAKRSQAIKMIRRGEAPESVSAALGVPRSHIQLLVKVQEMIQAK